jgi:hypothetical protein
VVACAKRQRLRVRWYGGTTRHVEVVSQRAHWYKTGHGLVPLRWVFVHDCTGTHRDEYFFTTAPALSPTQIEHSSGSFSTVRIHRLELLVHVTEGLEQLGVEVFG